MQGLMSIAQKNKMDVEGLSLNSGTWAPGMRLDRKRSYSYVSIPSAYVSIHQHTSACGLIPHSVTALTPFSGV